MSAESTVENNLFKQKYCPFEQKVVPHNYDMLVYFVVSRTINMLKQMVSFYP